MLVLVADVAMGDALKKFVRSELTFLCQHDLVATARCAQLFEFEPNVSVSEIDVVNGELTLDGKNVASSLTAAFYLRDPQHGPGEDYAFSAIMNICDKWSVPFATNDQTAKAIVDWLRTRKRAPSYELQTYLEMFADQPGRIPLGDVLNIIEVHSAEQTESEVGLPFAEVRSQLDLLVRQFSRSCPCADFLQ